MNRLDLLNEFRDRLNNNLLCYSENYLMTNAKKEYAKEWEETQEKIGLIEDMIEDEKVRIKEEEEEIDGF